MDSIITFSVSSTINRWKHKIWLHDPILRLLLYSCKTTQVCKIFSAFSNRSKIIDKKISFYIIILGYWLLHCHLDFHLEVGMGVILQVGKDDEMPPVPKHFPKCGNYRPHKDLNPQSILSTCDLEESCDVQTDNTNGIKKFVTKFLSLFNKASPMKTINRYIVFSFSILYIIRAL